MTKQLGRILTQARRTRGATLRDVEEATGISNAYVSQLESGRINEPSPHKLHKLAEYFGLDYGALLEGAGYAARPNPDSIAEASVHFMGDHLTEDEARAMSAFLRAYRDGRKVPDK